MSRSMPWDPSGPIFHQTLLAKHVAENHPAVTRLLKDAQRHLRTLTGDPNFYGYVQGRTDRVDAQAKAIYSQLRGLGLSYRCDPSIAWHGYQRIRTVAEVLREKHGTCVEFAAVFASCLQQVRIHPLIVVVGRDAGSPDHAILGYWLEDEVFTQGGQPHPTMDATAFQREASGIRLVEATSVALGSESTFEKARDDAATSLMTGRQVCYAVDIEACRLWGIDGPGSNADRRPPPETHAADSIQAGTPAAPAATIPDLFVKTYPRSQDPRFFDEVRKLIPRSRRIILIGTGLNLLWEQHIVDLIIQRARSADAEIDICLGNPYSPYVQSRLVEEEMQAQNPPLGKQGMERNIRALIRRLEGEDVRDRLRVSLFEHAPTFATLIFDRDIFVYPYGYRVVGNTSPLFHLQDNGSAESRFFLDHARMVLEDAVPAEMVVQARWDRRSFCDTWTGAAVYIVPDWNQPLYQFGSALLGYDIHARKAVPPEDCPVPGFRECAGEAAEYGFHATLADALYFATAAELERAKAELRFLADEFPPFELTDFKIANPFHDDPAIVALRCEDRGGKVEALHHELVARMYRIAISSTYRAGTTRKRPAPRKALRADFMMQRYGAPYILQEFDLHFTLGSSCPADPRQRREIVERLTRAFNARVGRPAVPMRDVFLVMRHPGEERWTVEARYPLGGQG